MLAHVLCPATGNACASWVMLARVLSSASAGHGNACLFITCTAWCNGVTSANSPMQRAGCMLCVSGVCQGVTTGGAAKKQQHRPTYCPKHQERKEMHELTLCCKTCNFMPICYVPHLCSYYYTCVYTHRSMLFFWPARIISVFWGFFGGFFF